jgi:hypothetical protein
MDSVAVSVYIELDVRELLGEVDTDDDFTVVKEALGDELNDVVTEDVFVVNGLLLCVTGAVAVSVCLLLADTLFESFKEAVKENRDSLADGEPDAVYESSEEEGTAEGAGELVADTDGLSDTV